MLCTHSAASIVFNVNCIEICEVFVVVIGVVIKNRAIPRSTALSICLSVRLTQTKTECAFTTELWAMVANITQLKFLLLF